MTSDLDHIRENGRYDPAIPVRTGMLQDEVTVGEGELAISAIPARPYRVDVTPDSDFVSINLGLVHSHQALGGDRIAAKKKLPGMMRFHPAGARTYCHGEVNDGELYLFWLGREMRQRMADDFGASAILQIENVREDLTSPAVIDIAALARRFVLGNGVGGRMAAQSLSVLALAEAMRLVLAREGSEPRSQSTADAPLPKAHLRRAQEMVEARLDGDIGLTDLAAATDLAPQRFARSFKLATGFTPHQYLIERRIQRAQALLVRTDEPIAEIAYACGFSSQSHMTSLFTKRLGFTPGRVRAASRS